MGCDWGPTDAGCLVCALDESYCQGFSSLACCSRQNQSIREVMRRAAKNIESVTNFLCAVLWQKRTLVPQIALVTNVNRYSSLLDSLARVLAAKCLQMSRNVYKCIRMSRQFQFFWTLFLRLTEQFLAVPEGYRQDDLGAFRSVSTDRFHLQVFFGREQWLLSSCPRMSTVWDH